MGDQLTYGQFAAFVLAGLGAPITQNNVDKLAAIGQQEGDHGTYNLMNWVRDAPGSTNFNSHGVKNYPNLGVGVLQTVGGLNQGNTAALKANLMSDGPYEQFIAATSAFYGSWGGGSINVTQQTADQAATTKLLEGKVTQPEIEGVAKAITPNHDIVAALGKLVPGVNADPSAPGGIPGVLWHVGSAISSGVDAAGTAVGATVGALGSVVDFLNWIKNAIFNKSNWVRIGLVIGALMLAMFGMTMLSHSLGGPGPSDVAKLGAAAAI